MCLPAAALAPALLATSVVSSVGGFVGQAMQANAQGKFQRSQYAAVSKEAAESYSDQVAAGNEQLAQESAAVARQSLLNAREGDQGAGIAAVRAAAGNVGGVTAAELVNEFDMLTAENENILRTNLAWSRDQMGRNFQGVQAQAQSRITSAAPSPIAGPNVFGLLTDLGSGFLNYQINQRVLKEP